MNEAIDVREGGYERDEDKKTELFKVRGVEGRGKERCKEGRIQKKRGEGGRETRGEQETLSTLKASYYPHT